MHILFLTDNFPPEVNAPASRTFEHCREWVRAGHRVTVLTCAPNFPRGEVFPGYRNRFWQCETLEGIEVVRVWTYISANQGFVRRVLDYQSFMVAAVLACPTVREVDVVIGTSPHIFTACAAYFVSRLKRIPFIFELRDLWPDSIRAVGAMTHERWLRRLERLELFLYRKAHKIVAVTQSFRSNLIGRGISPDKIEVITNGVDNQRFIPHERDAALVKELDLEGKFIGGYLGTHGMAHALETLLDAAKRLQDHPEGQDVRLLFLGDGAQKQALIDRAMSLQLKNVHFIDTVEKEEVVRYWSLLDVSIIHLKNAEVFKTVIPSKLFESMGMGIPVLHGAGGESAALVEKERCGKIFEPENAAALCRELLHLKASAAEREYYRGQALLAAGRYSRQRLALNMLQVIESTVNRRSAPDAVMAECKKDWRENS